MGDMADFYLDCEFARMTDFDNDSDYSGYNSGKRMYPSNLFVEKRTRNAILISAPELNKKHWLPLSQINIKDDIVEHEFNDIEIPGWLCEKIFEEEQ